ncbi:MAG TPA: DNA polymerase IV [Clostridiales bacterium]|jgi:DNA polymerase-4|nr:DNA polymerase IV [Clostridiales bacterium]
MERAILHCDANNFYASVECMLDTSLRDKPVAVCGSVEERHGIVLAKNYIAKAHGIITGEAVWQAKRKCRDLVVIPPHYEEYMKYSELAREIYARYTDLIEPYGMDENWLDVTGSRIFGSAEQIAEKIRQSIKSELGITISIGVSFNKVFAKLGSDMKKPDAITVIPRESFREIIWDLPVGDLLGVGRATKKILGSYCIRTIGDLARTPPDFLRRRFGKCGVDLWLFANGKDNSPVVVRNMDVPDKTVGHGITTLEDLENPAEVWAVMLELCQEIGHKLYTYNKKASGVSIIIRDNELFSKEWQYRLKSSTQSPSVIAREAFELFLRSYKWERPIRTVTVRAIKLLPEGQPEQLNIFFDIKKQEKLDALDRTIEALRARYGSRIIRHAVLLDNPKMPQHERPELIMPSGVMGA